MNLDAVNPELESKINDLVCETYNKSFLEQEKLLKEAFELIPKPVTQWAHPTTMVTIALFELYYKNQKYEQAKEWLSIALSVADLGTTNAGTYLLAGIFIMTLKNMMKLINILILLIIMLDIIHSVSRTKNIGSFISSVKTN